MRVSFGGVEPTPQFKAYQPPGVHPVIKSIINVMTNSSREIRLIKTPPFYYFY
jgi:hypothetical protein